MLPISSSFLVLPRAVSLPTIPTTDIIIRPFLAQLIANVAKAKAVRYSVTDLPPRFQERSILIQGYRRHYWTERRISAPVADLTSRRPS
jgi:hypothetical protein